MTDTVRCPACRGTKKVPKLGGMIGTCNTCNGKGTILAVDKPVKVEPITIEDVISKELINAVADVAPVTNILEQPVLSAALANAMDEVVKDKFAAKVSPVALPKEPVIKVDGKKAVFKHKQK